MSDFGHSEKFCLRGAVAPPMSLFVMILRVLIKTQIYVMIATKFSDRIKTFKPLLVICGCTGTGKSDLGIELAKYFNGEVINADSMQIYKGLDIATNKVTEEEKQGVPHHLMSFCDPCESNYNVHQYRDAVLPLIQNIWRNGKLPIIVGGTGYYMEAVIYYNNLISTNFEKSEILKQELLQKFPTCDLLHDELKRIDPISAAELHKNSRSKVLRALEIFYSTGVRKSEHQKSQREGQSVHFHFGDRLRFKNTLLVTLDADKKVLDERVNKRVDVMLKRGLIEELESFYAQYREHFNAFGIFQCIGLKEFIPYLQLSEAERNSESGQKLLNQCGELVKLHTRQYARNQRKWFYNRIHLRAQYREVPNFIALNTSANFWENVIPFATELTGCFLSGHDIKDVSPSNPSVLLSLPAGNKIFDLPEYTQSTGKKYCETCDVVIEIAQWESHLRGRKHKTAMSNITSD